MKTATENTIWTNLIPGSAVQTTGTIAATAFVSVASAETNVVKLTIGTANAGSVTYLEILAGTAATPGSSTVSLGTVGITAGTAGSYAIEVRSNQFTGTLTYIGARYFIPAGGSIIASVDLERTNLRAMPPTNGLNGSTLFLA